MGLWPWVQALRAPRVRLRWGLPVGRLAWGVRLARQREVALEGLAFGGLLTVVWAWEPLGWLGAVQA